MIKGDIRKELNIENVLDKVSEYDIFKFYMPHSDWSLNIATYSPFRNEHNPSFMIGDKHGRISFIDFADTSKRGGCFDFVMMLFNISLREALEKIDKDFGLGFKSNTDTKEYKIITSEYKQPIKSAKIYTNIQVVAKPFTKEELAYWNEYHLDIEDLKANNVYSISKVYLNKTLVPGKISELRFGYLYDDKWKIYTPFAKDKRYKWTPNNVPITAMDGKENIKDCNLAFINKSKKDHMVISKLYSCSCAVQNEGIGCFSEENIEYIKSNSKRQILSFDSDITGVTNSQQITKLFDFGYLNVPKRYLQEGIKDWADLARIKGMNSVENYLIIKNII